MTKKIQAILPQYTCEIIMDIIKNHGLDKRQELISEQLKNATDPEVIKSLLDDKPILVLAKIAKNAVEQKLSEDEISSLIREKLRLDKERAESLMLELKNKLIFFTETVEMKEEEEKEEDKKEKVSNDNLPEQTDNSKKENKISEQERESDPYREPIE